MFLFLLSRNLTKFFFKDNLRRSSEAFGSRCFRVMCAAHSKFLDISRQNIHRSNHQSDGHLTSSDGSFVFLPLKSDSQEKSVTSYHRGSIRSLRSGSEILSSVESQQISLVKSTSSMDQVMPNSKRNSSLLSRSSIRTECDSDHKSQEPALVSSANGSDVKLSLNLSSERQRSDRKSEVKRKRNISIVQRTLMAPSPPFTLRH